MFNEVPDNSPIKNWKDYINLYLIHDDKQIKGFFKDYRWLSNFWPTILIVFFVVFFRRRKCT
jgi:hypothetical protein